jgi:hypothetical protein
VQDGPWYFELMVAGQDVSQFRDKLLFGPSAVTELPPASASLAR